ncbi:hypothetical protein MtrunA17_Chr6g0455281 [Medicago truncatula]|uniref:Transmembrane protein n=1 Tax=Medicago truncatula TaxID=3880 RepID=A0A396HAI2_MEDTR|nr:hypothetical protein MtrunA17_Chr6g0455281 [Medicago truncatula]
MARVRGVPFGGDLVECRLLTLLVYIVLTFVFSFYIYILPLKKKDRIMNCY